MLNVFEIERENTKRNSKYHPERSNIVLKVNVQLCFDSITVATMVCKLPAVVSNFSINANTLKDFYVDKGVNIVGLRGHKSMYTRGT